MSTFMLTPGVDNFTGNPGEDNTVFLTPSTLQATDTITGGAAGPFSDILVATAGGTIAAAQFAGVTKFERLHLASAGNSVSLTNGLVGESSAGIFSVIGGAGDDTVNASAVTNGMRIAFYAGAGTDSFTGGNGNDYVEFAPAQLSAADLIDGGDAFDILAFSVGGAVSAAALAGVSNIEELILSNAGNSVTLSNAFVGTSDNGIISIIDGAGDDTVDASGITNGTRVAFYTSTGNETFIGGNGSDYLAFHAAGLTSDDHITGGTNSDIIEFDTAGAVAAGAFTNVAGIEVLLLNAGGNSLTLSNAMVTGSDNGLLTVIDAGSGNDALNASAVVANRIIFQSNGGNDSFTGGGGGDVMLFTAAGLTSGDTLTGGAGFDVLQLITAGTVASSAFTNVTGVDALLLTMGGNTITLNGGVVANSDNGVFVVSDQGGNNVVDGSAATLGGRIAFNAVAGDGKTYTGGTGSDFFDFVDASLNNTDTLAGGNGAGTDFLRVTTAASVTAADLANVTQMEVVQLMAGGSIALSNSVGNAGGSLEADGTAAVDTIDGSAVTSYNLVIKGNGGADTLKGGAGNDQVFLPDTNFVAIDGNGGIDKIVLTSAFNNLTFDLSTQVTKITDVEAITLEGATEATLHLGPGDIPQINSTTNLLYIVGDSDNHVIADGTWTALETNHTNTAVSATHTFIHFQNANGADLYVDSLIDLAIATADPDITDPVANPDVGTAVEDVVPAVSGNVLTNDTDDNALTVTTTGVFVGTYGNLSLGANGAYTYTLGVTAPQIAAVQSLAAGAVQTDVFNYTITDQSPPDSSSTLTISVYGTNDAPTATATVVPNATEDTAYSFNVSALFTDVDSVPTADTLSYSVAGLPSGLSFAGSTISGTPTNGDVGTYTISVTANDGHSGSLTRTFSFSVANTNDAPVGTAASYTINEDTPLGGTLAATDVDGDAVTFALVAGSATNGVATVDPDGTFTFTPAANFSGDATFQFRANDGTVNSAAQTVTIHVTPVNDAPTAAAAGNTTSTDEDNAFIGNVPAGSDVDDAILTYELVAGPNAATEGSLTFNTNGSFLFSPASNFNGAVTFTYRVLDPHGAHSDPQNFTITVNPVNDPVGAVNDSAGIAEDVDTNLATPGVQSVASGNLLANDNDGDPELVQDLDVTAVSGPGALTNTVTTLTRTDADGSLVIDKETGAYTYTIDNSSATVQALGAGESLSKVFTYTATDDGVPPQSTTTTLTVTIVGTNDGPVAVADTASVTEDSVLSASGNVLGPDNSGPVNDSDIDGDTLSVSAVNGSGAGVGNPVAGTYGSLTLNSDGGYTYNLTNANASVQMLGDGESLSDSFSYTVSDGHGGSATTTLSVTVNGTNAAPTVSLGSHAALNDTASSSDLGVAVADAAATVTDEEARIKAIEVDIASGYQDGTATTGERAELSPLGNFGLSLIGGSASFVDNGNHGTLTITFASPVSPANALSIFKQVNYVNQTGDFSLAVALDDTRTVTVRVQDHNLAWSATDTREVNVAANVLDGGSNGTFVGSRFADTINGAAGDDTLTGGKGDDSIIGGANTAAGDTVNYAKETDAGQVSETGTHGVAVNLSGTSYDIDSADSVFDPSHLTNDPTLAAGQAFDTYGNTDTLSGIENVVGTKYDDLIVDEKTASNSYSGGETAETSGDVVAFSGTLGPSTPGEPYFRVLPTGVDGDDFTVQYFDPNLGVGGTVLATDTLTDVENMIFDNGTATSILNAENPVWVIEDGYLVGTFSTVAAAVAKANLLGGTTVVEIGHGTTPPADYDEGTIDVTRAMTIKGIGVQQTIHATDDVDLFVVSGAASGLVRFENLALSDDGVGPTADYGIRFAGAYGINSSANLQLSGVAVSGFEQNGFLVIGGGTTVNVAVEQSTFSGNGGGANSGGSGDILFFEYTGAASLEDVTVTGTTSGTPAATADYGIQFAGFHDTNDAIANAIGNVSFDTVSVTGHYDNALVYIEGYNNLSGLSFTATTIGDAASTAGWTGLYVEPVSTGGPFTPSGTTSTLDLTNVTLAGTYGWQTTFQLPGADFILGVPTNDHIIGSGSNDAIRTLTGTDAIEAGGGNDLIVYDTLPGAKHTVDGGLGTDTQVVFGTSGAETFNVNAISATQLGINILAGTTPASTVAATGSNYEVATTAVEQINIQTGNGGDNVVITGDLAGTGVSTSTITVIGGTGNDTVDASGMLNTVDTGPGDVSRVGVDFTGGAGNDTFISNSIGSSDRFDGGTNTTGDTVNYGSVTGGGVSVHLGNQSAADIGGTGVGSDTLIGVENAIGSAQHDVLVGSSVVNTLDGGGGDDSLAGNAGNDTLAGGLGTDTADYSLESGTNGVTVDLGANTATDTFGNTDTLSSIENATGTSLADTLIGGSGVNVLTGLGGNDTLTGTGNDTLIGGANDDVYYAHMSDDVQENSGQGTDEVRASESYTLDANVENLTLLDLGVSDTQNFESFALGPIADGENGWKHAGSHDQEVVASGLGTGQAFRMSSDPSSGDFGGPYSPALSATAGEPQTSAAFDGHAIKFVFKPVDPTPDGSRLEVDFGTAGGTDRNNFLVLESTGAGIRIAVAEPNNVDGDFTGPGSGNSFPNDWRELVANVDPTVSHTLEMRLDYADGPNNDVINIYLDGQYIGATTTFENFRDLAAPAFLGATHADNAEANQTNRVFFRAGNNGQTQDGPGGANKGFYFDNVASAVYNNIDGTGNDLANIITGNAGDNTLTGAGANDQLVGGAGIDTAKYDDAYSNYAVTYTTDAHGFITGVSQVQETGPAGAVAEGTDTLTSIERLEFSGLALDLTKRVQLFDGANKLVGTFVHIQDAVNAATDGYTIRLAAGTFTESVTIDRNVAILGANSGDPGTGSRSAESIIAGQVSVTAAHSATQKVTIDGVEIFNTSNNTTSFTGIQVNTGADVTIKNSIFFSPGPNASSGTPDRAIMLTTGASGTIAIDHNLFTGAVSAHNLFSTAAWTTAIWSDGAQTAATVAFNTFEWVRTAINADDFDSSFNVVNNTFQNSGSGISIGGAAGGANAEVASITSIHDNTFSNVDTDFNLQNITAAGKQIGLDLTATNNHAVNTAADPVTVLAGANADAIKGSVGVDALIGNGGNDSLDGGAGNDGLAGNGADDTLHGGGGDDALFGGALAGADAGKDTATYDEARANYTLVATTADGFVTSVTDVTETTVTGTNEGHDTLSGVEVLQFSDVTLDLTQNVQLFDSTGKLIGTFGTIQSAVNAAAGNGGINETIRIRDGVYTEQVTIDGTAGTLAGLTITGVNADGNPVTGVTIKAPAVLGINGTSDHWGDDVRAGIAVKNVAGVTIANLTVDGSYAGDTTPGSNGDEITGVAYLHASGTISGVHVEHTSNSTGGGLFGLQHGSGIFADNGTGTQLSLAITGSTVDTFQKTGILVWNANVDMRDNTVAGIGATALTAQNAMQIGGSSGAIGAAGHGNTFGGVGYTGGTWSSTDLIVYEPTAALTIASNTFNGTGNASALTVGLDLTDVDSAVTVTVSNNAFGTAGHGLLDGIDAYTYDGTVGLGSDPVMSGNTFTEITGNGIFLDPEFVVNAPAFTTGTAFTETGSQFADVLHGSNGADNFSGGAGNDDLQGRLGADIINGGAGNDTIAWAAGDGNDSIDGGNNAAPHDDTDTLDVAADGHNLTLTATGSSFTVAQDDSPATNTATVTEVEEVDITLSGGETITLVGDFTAAGVDVNSIVVDGSAGTAGETVDAGGMTSTQHIDFTGGSGNDTFVESNAGGNDTFDGGLGVDTVDFSHETTGGITVDLSNTAAQNTVNAGTDTFTGVENAIGTGFADTITGNGSANMLVGGNGADTFTGGLGNDTIYGGTSTADTSTADKATFSGSSATYTITFDPFAAGGADGIDATVSGADGTDTLHGVELLQFGNGTIDLTKGVLLFDSANHLVGTFDHIQDAVNAADGSGDTIKVRNGLYVEQVTVDATKDNLKIIGESEAGVTVRAPGVLVSNGIAPSNGRNINGIITVDGADNVQVKTLTVDGATNGGAVVGASNPTLVGVAYLNATAGLIDHVTVTHVREPDAGFGNQRNLGIFVSNSNPSGSAPTTPSIAEAAALKTIEISHTTVTDFQKGGIVVSFANASVHDNVVTGHGLTGLTAQNGIQLAGSTGSVNGNTVTAVGYNNPAVAIGYAILTFNNRDVTIDGNHITGTGVGPTDSSGGIAAIGSTGVVVTNNDIHQVIDAMDVYATASFVDALAPSAASNPGGVFDFSTNAVDADVPSSVFFRPFATSTDTFVVTGTNRGDELHGAAANDTLNGGAGDDFLDGRGGADTIDGGTGNDVILISAPSEFAAGETIEGGANSDTIRFASTTTNDALTLSSAVTGVENVTISDANGVTTGTTALNIDASAVTTALSITGNDGANSLTGTALADTLSGGGGNDLLTGGNGGDTIHGGSGLDTAVYTTAYAGHTVAWNGTTATVTGGTDTGLTGDTIDTTGKLQFADKAVWLVNDEVGSEYTTLAQLFDGNAANGEAANGDVIILDDGTYVGDVVVNKAVTILGANAGTAGTASRGTESIIEGQLFVTAGATIDGIEVHNTTNNATQFIGVRIQNTAADVTVKNSLFYSTGPNGSAEDRAINMDTSVSGHVTIANNLITGDQTTSFGNSNWHRGIWSDGSTSQLDITGNTLDHVRSGMNLDGLDNAHTNVSGNTFLADGTGIAVGGNYVGSPAALTLTAIHDNFFNNTGEDLNVQNFTTAVSFDATATNNTATEAGTPVFFVDGGRGADTLTGTAGADVLLGHALDGMAGNDSNTLTGKGGDDLLIGASGTGADTAVYSGTITAANIAATSALTDTNPFVAGTQPGWTVSGGAEGTDTLSEIEIVDGNGAGRFLLVGNGGFDSVTAALAAAVGGDTILVAPGTYNENIVVNTANVTIKGAGAGVIIHGTFKSDNGIVDGGVAAFLKSGAGYTQVAGSGIVINADNVSLDNLRIDGFTYGVNLGDDVDFASVSNVSFTGNLVGIKKGTTADITNFSLTGSSITDGLIGIDFDKDVADATPAHKNNGLATGVTIDGVSFTHLVYKGAYFEALSNAHLTNITMDDVAQYGAPSTSGTAGSGGNGIDLNLKNGDYSNVEIDHFTLNNTGASDRDGLDAAGHQNGGAIVLESRDLGSYLLVPATFTGAINVHDGTISGHTSTGIQVGEPNQSNLDPDVTITNVSISGEQHSSLPNGHGDVANVTQSTVTVNMLNGGDSMIASPTTTGRMVVNGGTGADTITTGDGADTIDGGAGTDTVDAGAGNDTVIGTADGVNDSYTGGSGTDTIDYSALTALQNVSVNLGSGFASGGSIGTDTLSGFENANGGAGNDSVFGSNANNVLHGNGGIDNIVGSGGSDQLFGDAGDDTLNGGVNDFGMTPAAANDVLWGGTDHDTFRFEGRFGDDSIGTVGHADWDDGEDMVFVGYASHTPTIADVAGGVMITIDDGSVASSVFVAGAVSAQMQQLISGTDLIVH